MKTDTAGKVKVRISDPVNAMLELFEELNAPFPKTTSRNAEAIFLADLLMSIKDIDAEL